MDSISKNEKEYGRIKTRTTFVTYDVDWLLNVHFQEDWCRIEDNTVLSNLNIFRKEVINLIKFFNPELNLKKLFQKL